MEELMPYVVSIVTAALSSFISIYVCNKNCKNELNKMQLQNQQDIEKMRQEQNNELEKIKLLHQQEMEKAEQAKNNEIERLREETGLKTVSNIAETLTSAVTETVLESPAVKNQINRQANRSFVSKKKRK